MKQPRQKVTHSSKEIVFKQVRECFSAKQEIIAILDDKIQKSLQSSKHPRYFDALGLVKAIGLEGNVDSLLKMSQIITSSQSLLDNELSTKDLNIILDCLFDSRISYHNVDQKISHLVRSIKLNTIDYSYKFGGDQFTKVNMGGNCADIGGYCYRYLQKHLSKSVALDFVYGHSDQYFLPETACKHFYIYLRHHGNIYIFDPSFGIFAKEQDRKYIAHRFIKDKNIGNDGYINLLYGSINERSIEKNSLVIGLYEKYIISFAYAVYHNQMIIPLISSVNAQGRQGIHYYDKQKDSYVHEGIYERHLYEFIEEQLQKFPIKRTIK